MITEDYVSFETAKLLEEKGFDEPCESAYTENGQYLLSCYQGIAGRRIKNSESLNFSYSVVSPTLQMATKWLRENFNMNPVPYATSIGWYFEVFDLTHRDVTGCVLLYRVGIPSKEDTFNTFEKACDAAIKYCLENLI